MLAALAFFALVQTPSPLQQLQSEALSMAAIVETSLARGWLKQVTLLGEPASRVVFRDPAGEFLSLEQATALPRDRQRELRRQAIPARFFYSTRYGSPLAYARLVDIAARNGLTRLAGKKALDIGFGTVGHLQLLAHAGAEAHGIEVDSLLRALYSAKTDTGRMGAGSVRLHFGFFPGDARLAAEVGAGYDLITAKNTLKRGYIHPERPTPKEQLIDLGVDDATYLREIHRRLKPGGLFVVYNLSPRQAPADKPYIPWADGRFPFERVTTERTGFEVLAWDQDDLPWAKRMARGLGWDKTGMDVDEDLQAHLTVLRRRR